MNLTQIEQVNDNLIKVPFKIGDDVKFHYIKLDAVSSHIAESSAVHAIKIYSYGQHLVTVGYLNLADRDNDLQKIIQLISR